MHQPDCSKESLLCGCRDPPGLYFKIPANGRYFFVSRKVVIFLEAIFFSSRATTSLLLRCLNTAVGMGLIELFFGHKQNGLRFRVPQHGPIVCQECRLTVAEYFGAYL